MGTRTTSLNALDHVTLQTSNGGTLIQWFRSYLQYLGGIASPFIFRFYYKSFQTSFFSLFIRVCNFKAFISPHSSYLHKRDFKDPPEKRRSVRILPHVSFVLRTSSIFLANRSLIRKLKMGRFECLVKTLALIELFKEKYHIPQEVVVRQCTTEGVEIGRAHV